jgi:two-component system cell cycle sensor histidine kinase/response regulator CckA
MHLVHDLRNALIAIAACVELLRVRSESQRPLSDFDLVRGVLNSAFQIVNDLMQTTDRRPLPSLVDINRFLQDATELIGALVGSHVLVRTALRAERSRVFARPIDLERLLLNLILNAASAMPENGTLTIETESLTTPAGTATDPAAPFGDVRLTITDSGRGMSPAQLQRALDPAPPPRPDGSGLGLACVALVVTRLGGKLEIGSRLDVGTIVRIDLPLAPPSTQTH